MAITVRMRDLANLNLVVLGFGFRLKPIFAIAPADLKNTKVVKSDSKIQTM